MVPTVGLSPLTLQGRQGVDMAVDPITSLLITVVKSGAMPIARTAARWLFQANQADELLQSVHDLNSQLERLALAEYWSAVEAIKNAQVAGISKRRYEEELNRADWWLAAARPRAPGADIRSMMSFKHAGVLIALD